MTPQTLAGRRARRVTVVRVIATAAWVALLALGSAAIALEVPFLSGRVNDTAAILSSDAKQRIEEELRKLEEDTGAQVAVLTIPALDGESLEEYSLRVAETWKLGRGKFDDGALVLIARDDRQMRIEVGYGLEPAITDAKSRRILDDVMRPRFREGDFDGGVETAVKAISGLVRGDENALPSPAPSSGVEGVAPRALMFLIFAVVIGVFSMVALATEGAGAWFFYLFLTPFYFAFPIATFGRFGALLGLGWLVAFPILHRLFRKKRKSGKLFKGSKWATGGTPGGGWVWTTRGGGWGGGSGRGWGGGGGGFSGGGGSFGGGGASGRW